MNGARHTTRVAGCGPGEAARGIRSEDVRHG